MPPDAVLHTLLPALERMHLGLSLGLLAVALLRRPWRRLAGPQAAYGLWALPVVLALTGALPAPQALRLNLPAVQVMVLGGGSGNAGAQSLGGWLAWAWLAGAALATAALWHQHRRYLRQLRPAAHGRWQAPAGTSPGLLGVWRPRLVLPQDLRQRFTAGERRWILAHEHVHARRGDNPARLAAAAVAALAWFNPLVWWALGALRHDQELACDAAVMQRFPLRWRAYGLALLKLDGATSLPPTASAWQSHHPLKERILMLNAPHRPIGRRTARAALAATSLLGLALLQSLVVAAPNTQPAEATRLTAREACPQMPRPEVPDVQIPSGDYRMQVHFRIGTDGRPSSVRIDGDRPRIAPFVAPIEQSVRAYQCKVALAGAEITQDFAFKID